MEPHDAEKFVKDLEDGTALAWSAVRGATSMPALAKEYRDFYAKAGLEGYKTQSGPENAFLDEYEQLCEFHEKLQEQVIGPLRRKELLPQIAKKKLTAVADEYRLGFWVSESARRRRPSIYDPTSFVEMLQEQTSLVENAARGKMPVAAFVKEYGDFYYAAALNGYDRGGGSDEQLFADYKEVRELHEKVQFDVVDPSLRGEMQPHTALAHLREIAEKYHLSGWMRILTERTKPGK